MPTYTFVREDGTTLTKRVTFSDFRKIQKGDLELKDDKGQTLSLVFNPQNVQFNLKDGISGSWPSKVGREKTYRDKRFQVMGQRQRDHVFKTKLIPNYVGQEAGSWREAQNMAATDSDVDKDIRTGIAKGYNSLVAKEKAKT